MDQNQQQEIEELKELVQRDIAIGAETRDMVHQMRRSARWGLFFTVLYWLLILGVLGASYYYVSPYINKIFGVYQSIEHNNAQSQNIFQNIEQTLGKLVPSQGSTTRQ